MNEIFNKNNHNEKKVIYLTLDLEKDYGTALNSVSYSSFQISEELSNLLFRLGIKLTIFVQTKIIENHLLPECFDKNPRFLEIEPHGYSHLKRKFVNIDEEVEKSTKIFNDYLNLKPIGFRFPDGDIRVQDYKILEHYGYKYDSSIFPIWRPGRFNNLHFPQIPFKIEKNIIEIPFSIINLMGVKIPLSLSYFKFLNLNFKQVINSITSNRVIFGFHLHDLYVSKKSFNSLPIIYKCFYWRNRYNGFEYFRKIISFFMKSGWKFELLSDYYEFLKKQIVNS